MRLQPLVLLVLLLAPAPVAGAQATEAARTTLTATRAMGPPAIDGSDGDEAWRLAERRSDFRTFTPNEGGVPAFRTELRVAYDDRALYVFVRAFDPRPDSIVRLLSRRDTDGAPNDQVQLFLDSYRDRRSGYEYIVNAAGVKSDYVLFDDTGFDQSWNGVWDVATRVDSAGWSAEFAIPLQQLRFRDRESPVFGLMVWRLVGRTGERVSWPPYRPSRSGYVSQTGTLEGIRGLVRPVSLEATPYTLARTRNAPSSEATRRGQRRDLALGGDVRFLPVPNVSVDATFNPDFGQVESDPAVLDLSGFEVFQGERRPFFLEGAGQLYFPLAGDGSAVLFHSRRIGRAPAIAPLIGAVAGPTETTIHAAAKLTARVSPATSLVLLSAATSQEVGALPTSGRRQVVEPRAHYGVARLQRDFRGGRSGVGIMVTRVAREGSDSLASWTLPSMAQAAAMSTQHQTADGNYRMSGWIATSSVRGTPGSIGALQLSNVHGFQRPDDGVGFDSTRRRLAGSAAQVFLGKVAGGITRWDASYRWISPGFDVNEMGFLTRAGMRSLAANAGLRANRAGRAAGIPYRTAALMLGVGGDWTSSGLSLGRTASLTGSLQLANQATVQGTFSQQIGSAYCAMTCTRGGPALVDPARTTAAAGVTGDPRRRVVPGANVAWYRDDEGRSHGGATQIDLLWRARPNLDLSIAAGAERSAYDAFFYRRIGAAVSDTARVLVARLEQPMRLATARADYTVTTTLSVQWYAQAYLSRGNYSNVRELADPRADRYDDRFRAFTDSAGRVGVDFRQFRSNTVLRWEYRPGSALFLVWTQGRDLSSSEPGALRVGPDLRELFGLRPINVIALKASYWISR